MFEMITFWVVYGVWMVLSWGGIVFGLSVLADSVLKWITGEDYNLKRFLDKVFYENMFINNALIIALLFVFTCAQVFHTIILIANTFKVPERQQVLSYHELAVKIANGASEYLTTTIISTLFVILLVVLAKKGYPFIKKVLALVESVNRKGE